MPKDQLDDAAGAADLGRVVAVRGPVIDVAFDRLPAINEALRIDGPAGDLFAEVQSHLDERTVRGMKIASPLESHTLFLIGPVPITTPVVTTWAIMAALTIGGWSVTRRLTLHPSRTQATFEMIVDMISGQIRETMDTPPARYLSLIGTIFVFVLISNWSSLIPGVEPPTAALETDAALALIVFVATIFYGVRAIGPRRYLLTFAQPSIFMLPLNVLELFTRSLSLTVRLFGNVMSGVFIIAVVLGLAGLLVPIPLMALELLTGAVQAYIFCALAMVFIGGAIAEGPDSRHPAPQAKASS